MRLVNYGAGEIVDRIAILTLKIRYAEETGVESAHFRNERAALLPKLTSTNHLGGYLDAIFELTTINGMLWRAEDELRDLREADRTAAHAERVIRVAFRIQDLNDRRAQIVGVINKATGEYLGQEKL